MRQRTVLALERGEPGIYNVVDDDPAPVREWLPSSPSSIGAVAQGASLARPRRRRRVGVVLMTEIRGASNAKAKRELGGPYAIELAAGFQCARRPARHCGLGSP